MKKYFLLLLIAGVPALSWAQQGSGNGGDPNELATSYNSDTKEFLDSWYAVKMDLLLGLESKKYLDLDLKGMPAVDFRERFSNSLKSAKVEFDDQAITVEDASRPCENFIDQKGLMRIHCNLTKYKAAMQGYTSETQYRMVAHEYLGCAGLERNQFGVSDYRYSDQISSKLNRVVVKKWNAAPVCSLECEHVLGFKYSATSRKGFEHWYETCSILTPRKEVFFTRTVKDKILTQIANPNVSSSRDDWAIMEELRRKLKTRSESALASCNDRFVYSPVQEAIEVEIKEVPLSLLERNLGNGMTITAKKMESLGDQLTRVHEPILFVDGDRNNHVIIKGDRSSAKRVCALLGLHLKSFKQGPESGKTYTIKAALRKKYFDILKGAQSMKVVDCQK